MVVNSTAFESDDMKMGSKLDVELSETSFTAGSAPVMIASTCAAMEAELCAVGCVLCAGRRRVLVVAPS